MRVAALAFVLVGRFGVMGLGLSFGLAYVLSAVWAIQVLNYKVRGFDLRRLLLAIAKTLLAGVVMAELIWAVTRPVGSNTGLGALARIVIGIVVVVIGEVVGHGCGAPAGPGGWAGANRRWPGCTGRAERRSSPANRVALMRTFKVLVVVAGVLMVIGYAWL